MLRVTKDPNKEALNRRKHGLDFSLAETIYTDPLSRTLQDRIENGERRWQTVARVGDRVLVLVHTFPAGDDVPWIRVIGLRRATRKERRLYEDDRS